MRFEADQLAGLLSWFRRSKLCTWIQFHCGRGRGCLSCECSGHPSGKRQVRRGREDHVGSAKANGKTRESHGDQPAGCRGFQSQWTVRDRGPQGRPFPRDSFPDGPFCSSWRLPPYPNRLTCTGPLSPPRPASSCYGGGGNRVQWIHRRQVRYG